MPSGMDLANNEGMREFHFHVYFEPARAAEAEALRRKIVEAVDARQFVCVIDGVTDDAVPGLGAPQFGVNAAPRVRRQRVRAAHPLPSYEIWVPREFLAATLAFVLTHRGGLSVMLHPLTDDAIADHTTHAMWLGAPLELRVDVLHVDDDAPQFAALGLGAHAGRVPAARGQWWHDVLTYGATETARRSAARAAAAADAEAELLRLPTGSGSEKGALSVSASGGSPPVAVCVRGRG